MMRKRKKKDGKETGEEQVDDPNDNQNAALVRVH
jgi:hypothetical protein